MRLEPSPFLENVDDICSVNVFPRPVLFWNRNMESLSRHRNPIFDKPNVPGSLGITAVGSITIDSLHCLYLGVFNAFACVILWLLILSGSWTSSHGTADEIIEACLMVFRNRLRAWYAARKRLRPQETITEVSEITKKMLGDPSSKKLPFKGAETWWVLLFLLDELAIYRLSDRLLKAGRSLEKLIDCWNSAGWRLSDREIRTSFL